MKSGIAWDWKDHNRHKADRPCIPHNSLCPGTQKKAVLKDEVFTKLVIIE